MNSNKSCLDYIFKKKYPAGAVCSRCKSKKFYHIAGRKSYACRCGFQISPTENTIFEKSSTQLIKWFLAIRLMLQSDETISAKELERQLNVTYKCALRIKKQIKKLINDKSSFAKRFLKDFR